MDTSTADVLGPLFYGQACFAGVVLGWWFIRQGTSNTKAFGAGLHVLAAAFAAWTAANVVKPDGDALKAFMLTGSIIFLTSTMLFARVGWRAIGREFQSVGMVIALVMIAATLITRLFVAPSNPHFNDDGWLYLGVHPVVAAFYIATLTMTLLPAIGVVVKDIPDRRNKMVMHIGFSALFVNVIVVFASRDNALIEINSTASAITVTILWIYALAQMWRSKVGSVSAQPGA